MPSNESKAEGTAAASAAKPPKPVDFKALPKPALEAFVTETLGHPRFRADQVFSWLHQKRTRSFEDMRNVPKALKEAMASKGEVRSLELDEVRTSKDGTRKLLLRTQDGHRIESVIIPMEDRITQCVSSQVGCKIGCTFCLTGRMKTRKNLSAGEIVDQIYWALEVMKPSERITNIVYMGMGEPLDNYEQVTNSIRILLDQAGLNFSGRRITVSTSGMIPKMVQLGHDVPVNLAISLNATTDETRTRLIPINKVWNLEKVLQGLRDFPLASRRRITVEYVMLQGVNDTSDDARRLVKLLRGIRCKVNLIPFNPWPGAPYGRPDDADVNRFGAILRDAKYTVTVRYSKGDDIGAACGQLDGAEDGGDGAGSVLTL
jgi:23S rRNA (adenine2503-C2)-methyltransferase